MINIKRKIYKLIWFTTNYYKLKKNKVSIETRNVLKIEGKLFVLNEGCLQINNILRINSIFNANPIGGQTFTSLVVTKNASLVIDDGVGLSNSSIFCMNSILIGKNVYIGGDCKIYDTDFHSLNPSIRISGRDTDIKTKPVIIKDCAFIGAGSIILKGSVIGENSIIGAGSVVRGLIPDNQIWAGNPAVFVRQILIK